jgi:hypothetical protein
MFINVLGQHVSILIESSSGASKKIGPYLEMLKCAVGSQRLTFLINLCIKCINQNFKPSACETERIKTWLELRIKIEA